MNDDDATKAFAALQAATIGPETKPVDARDSLIARLSVQNEELRRQLDAVAAHASKVGEMVEALALEARHLGRGAYRY